jgi:hypothetical protein
MNEISEELSSPPEAEFIKLLSFSNSLKKNKSQSSPTSSRTSYPCHDFSLPLSTDEIEPVMNVGLTGMTAVMISHSKQRFFPIEA